MFRRVGKLELTEFGNEQFKRFEQMLALAKPKAVVVINALASRLYKKRRPLQFDSARGHYLDNIGERGVPVFLSGMLTGGRALDVFSRERLYWHIAQALGKPWNPAAQTPLEDDPDGQPPLPGDGRLA